MQFTLVQKSYSVEKFPDAQWKEVMQKVSQTSKPQNFGKLD